jgi:hypothetical protein
MPQAEHCIEVLIRHHPDDNHYPAGGKGRVAVFREFLEAALGKDGVNVRLQHELEAGREVKDVDAYEAGAHLVVFVFSKDFLLDDDLLMRFEALNGGTKPHAVLYLCTCPYDKMVSPECLVVPGKDNAIDICGLPEAAIFTQCAKAIAGLLKDLELAAPLSSITPEQVQEQQSQVLSALLELNYTQQPKEFKRCTVLTQVLLPTAFLVHGRMTYDGGKWLISRLLRDLPDRNPRIWELNAKGAHMRMDKGSNGLLYSLIPKLGLGYTADYGAIKDRLLDKLHKETGTLVIQISGVELFLLSPTLPLFEDFRTKFWEPLTQAAQAHPEKLRCRLIFFFVAESEMDQCQHFEAYNQANPTWKPTRLQKVDAFNAALLEDWLDHKDAFLNQLPLHKPVQLIDPAARYGTIADIIQNSDNGLPEMVLQYLSRLCGCEFDDLLKMLPAHETTS